MKTITNCSCALQSMRSFSRLSISPTAIKTNNHGRGTPTPSLEESQSRPYIVPINMKFPLFISFSITAVIALSLQGDHTLIRRAYCSNPQQGNGCNMPGNAPCCVDANTVASCLADRSISGVSSTDGTWEIESCQLGCYIDNGGVGHCTSESGCDCNDSCCSDGACQASQEYCGLTGDCECDGPYAKR